MYRMYYYDMYVPGFRGSQGFIVISLDYVEKFDFVNMRELNDKTQKKNIACIRVVHTHVISKSIKNTGK